MSPAPHASVSFLTQAFLESVPFSLELIVCSHQECARSPRVAVFRPPESSLRSGPGSPSTDGWGPVGGRMRFCTCGLAVSVNRGWFQPDSVAFSVICWFFYCLSGT